MREGEGFTGTPALTAAVIQRTVAQAWGVTVDGLRSASRTKHLTVPRQVAMFLIRELLGTQLVEIGNAFGGRDHSTVIHSIEKVERTLEADETFGQRVLALRGTLQQLQQ